MSTPPTGDAPSTGGREGDSAYNSQVVTLKENGVRKIIANCLY